MNIYIIDHPDTGRILYLIDTYLCEYKVPDLNHIIIEANYSDETLEDNMIKGIEHLSKRNRLLGADKVYSLQKCYT